MMLMRAPHPPNPVQIRKLIVSPEDRDGDIWGDPDDSDEGSDDSLFPSNSSEYEARLIIKAEYSEGPWGGTLPGETETEYLWRVCLSGANRIMLSGDEANGYWCPGVFLNLGLDPVNEAHSITRTVAYWARGIDALE
ncbi:hypothetical protein GRJ2_003214000 [Grus japonensis]|uniref:Uncharacterized protein n=1 Tax=Grus japonensis TaxID=30415 RepID=A0ABC9YBP7_GRUJA